jgi:hypothetical protein
MVYDYELTDPLGNRFTVEPLTDSTVIIRITQDDDGIDGNAAPQAAQVIVTLDEIRELADAVRGTHSRHDRPA